MLWFSSKSDPELHAHRHGLYFAFYNALNWQVGAGIPTVLFMEYLGANSFQAGLVYGWTLLLTPVQVFATLLLPRWGFKKLTMAGWGARGWFLLVPLGLALAGPAVGTEVAIAAMVVAMFCYSFSRAVGSAAITTWITALVPDRIRGKYWSTDQIMGGTAAVGTLLVCATMFTILSPRWAFVVQYIIAIFGSFMAFRCLQTMPDIEKPMVLGMDKIVRDTPQLLFARSPFVLYLWIAVAYFVVTAPIGPLGAYFLKATVGLSTATIMGYSMAQYLGVIIGNAFMRSRIDRTGAKPFFRASFFLYACIAAGWLGCLQAPVAFDFLMPLVFFLLGAASGMFTAANVNYLAKIVPARQRALPLSVHGALTAFLGGLSPVFWGYLLKADGGARAVNLLAFQVFFGVTLLGALGLVLFCGRLVEKPGHVDPLLEGSWLFRPFRAVTNLINLVEPRRTPRRDDETER